MKMLRRYEDSDRMNHWLVVVLFVLAGLSGLVFFHPSLYFLNGLFGGGTWARILHPFFGLAMALCFVSLFVKLWQANVMNADDKAWRAKMGDMLRGDKSGMPPVGKYNAGQKAVFWIMSLSLALLVLTGIMFWQPWFAGYFPVLLRRIAVVVHAASAVALILSVIMHVYAAIWVKGTLQAMTRGTVSEAWAKQNHALWHRDMTQGGK